MLKPRLMSQERQPATCSRLLPTSGSLTVPRTATARPCLGSPASQHDHPNHDHSEGAEVFWWGGKRTTVIRDHNGLLLEQNPYSCWLSLCTDPSPTSVKYVPYSEILCCRYLPIRRYCSNLPQCWRKQRHYMELQVLSRHPSRPWQWGVQRLELSAEQPEQVKAWVVHTQQQLRALSYRPQRLLVFVNPFGGKRQARRTWVKLAEPILAAAGVQYKLVETQYQGHAQATVGALTLTELGTLDGLVAVGGDGLFAELLTAVLQHRHLSAALQLRLGHIPAGSTDAVACTLHGTRDAVTAALHVALGDCTALDVGRMVTLPPATQPAAATASTSLHKDLQQTVPATRTYMTPAAAAVGQSWMMPGNLAQRLMSGAAGGAAGAQGSVGSQSELLLPGPGQLLDHAMQAADISPTTPPLIGDASTHSSRLQQQQQQRRKLKQQAPWPWRRSQQQSGGGQLRQQPQDVRVHIPQLRHFVCVANYGFLGDVMDTSERLRWCGPVRYDIAGALRFLLLRHYTATVWYKPADPSHADTDAVVPPTQQQQQQGQQRSPSDTVVPPTAVLPLPHHRAPALHARLSLQGTQPPWQQRQRALDSPDSTTHSTHTPKVCCEHSGDQLSSSSRRSSIDQAAELVTAGNKELSAAPNGAAAVPFAAAVASLPTPPVTAASSASSESSSTSTPQPVTKPQQQGKTVSFLPQLAAAVHASAASFSSMFSGGPAGSSGGGGLSGGPSRASSVTSHSSRCHSRCSRCSAAVMQRSNSRQTFAGLTAAAEAVEAAPAAGTDAVVLDVERSPRPSSTSSKSQRASDAADGIVHVMPVRPGASVSGTAAHDCAIGSTTAAAAVCTGSSGMHDVAVPEAAAAATVSGQDPGGGPPGPGWVRVDGEFTSVMCVVTSCISDKSRQGLMPEAHLADGRLALVLVERCSRLQYLRFLIQLASKGIVPGSLPFVKVEYATEVQVETQGRQSSWNVDGELLRHGRVNVGIHAGLVDVFARGVELM